MSYIGPHVKDAIEVELVILHVLIMMTNESIISNESYEVAQAIMEKCNTGLDHIANSILTCPLILEGFKKVWVKPNYIFTELDELLLERILDKENDNMTPT